MSESINVELVIPCLSEFVGIARLSVSGIASRMNFSVEDIEDIKIAVSEACTNSVQYAYEKPENEKIYITSTLYDDRLEIIVADNGKGFDVNSIDSNKTIEIIPDKLGLGLGITFIKSLMDEAYIESGSDKGTTIKMVKYTKK